VFTYYGREVDAGESHSPPHLVLLSRFYITFPTASSSGIDTQSTTQNPTRIHKQVEATDMALPRSEYLSDVWKDGIFDNKVVFCTVSSAK
jgi:hypothetical protein